MCVCVCVCRMEKSIINFQMNLTRDWNTIFSDVPNTCFLHVDNTSSFLPLEVIFFSQFGFSTALLINA